MHKAQQTEPDADREIGAAADVFANALGRVDDTRESAHDDESEAALGGVSQGRGRVMC
jgi:hypothetical protein